MPIIGSGAFGTIFQVRDRRSNRTFAVKVMQRQHYEMRGMGKQLSTEVNTMQRAASIGDPGWSRVVQLHGVQEEAGCIFLLLELCMYGNLTQQMTHHPQGLSEATAARCTRHLLQGLRDIHAAGIIHRDIKLENLLITTNGVLKITDFGWAAEARDKPRGLAGTYDTMAPEVLQNVPQTIAVDMWSAGAVLFHMVCGKKLLQATTATHLSNIDPQRAESKRRERLLREIKAICPLSSRARPKHVSEACWDLIRRLLQPDVQWRLTAAEALDHAWLRGESCVSQDFSLARGRMGGA
jgi:serine/threonine protein kinase